MSYRDYKPSLGGYTPFRPTRKAFAASKVLKAGRDDRATIFQILALTPIGSTAKAHYEMLERKIGVTFILDEANSQGFTSGAVTGLAGCTDPDPPDADFPESIVVKVSAIPIASGYQRMQGWTREERIHIITVHESFHMKKSGKIVPTPDTIYDSDEREIVEAELQARFEYSILFPEKSTSKDGWLDRYKGYFAVKNKKKENPVLDAYLEAVTNLFDAGLLSQADYDKAMREKDCTFLVK